MPITITTWNIQNFTSSDPLFSDKRDLLVGTLQALGSDVIALQEVLHQDAIQALADGLGFQQFTAEPDGRGNRVGFLTRNPPSQQPQQIDHWRLPQGVVVHSFDNSGNIEILTEFARPALQITVEDGSREIVLITAHLKSKLLTFQGNFSTTDETLRAHSAHFAIERRAAEATTLREHATSLLEDGRDVVILGDLNDGPEAATTQILYGPPGSQPRGPDDATRAGGAFQRTDKGDGRRMFNVTKLVPEEIRWTRRHNGQNELLDHILSSEGLMPRVNGLRQVPSMSILNEDTPNMFGAHPTAGVVVPDHAPVTATYA